VRLRITIAALALLLAAPATALAGELRKEGSFLIYQGDAVAAEFLTVDDFIANRIDFFRAAGIDIDGSVAGDCTQPDPTYEEIRCDKTLLGPVTRVILIGGAGGDQFNARFLSIPTTAQGGDGDDRLFTGSTADVLEGGAGPDYLDGYVGADTLRGGAGRDTLHGGLGGDVLEGGTQFDSADYGDNGVGVVVTIGAGADDGAAGEGDDVRLDVEDVRGSSHDDRLVGSDGSNELIGGAGNDELTGRGGFDSLIGGDGGDRIVAQDGGPDQVTCADGFDTAFIDAVDALSECEAVDATNVLQPDRDADGIDAPIDCDDTRADVHPGAGDVPDNGVDEDCSGADATDPDRDGDGFQRPEDCDDAKPGVNPGAVEVPGNKSDEDCDGKAAPFVRVSARIRNAWALFRDGTEPRRLAVTGLVAPATVELRCKGPGCPSRAARKRIKVGRAARPVNLLRALGRPRLRPGAVVQVRVTKPGQLGKVVRYRVRDLKLPASSTRCVAPGKRKERRC
jgi:hypothetical protein